MKEISVGGTGSIHHTENDQVKNFTSVEFTPRYGYFVTDRLEVMGSVGAEYEDVEYKTSGQPLEVDHAKTQFYSAALALQYNFDNGERIIPFARGFYGIGKARKETVQKNIPLVGTAEVRDETTAWFFGGRLGVRYFLHPRISTDVGLGWKRVMFDEDFGGDTDDTSVIVECSFFF
jgi:hypothetical protein